MTDARLRAYTAAAAVFALDRATKWIIERYVSFTDVHPVIPGLFDIVHSQNRGVAFGILNNSTASWHTLLLTVISLTAVVVVAGVLWRARRLDRMTLWGLACILGGAAGNVFDRLISGQVTDFLELYLGRYHWPTFNVADSAIVIGSGLFLMDALRPKRQAANVP